MDLQQGTRVTFQCASNAQTLAPAAQARAFCVMHRPRSTVVVVAIAEDTDRRLISRNDDERVK